VDLAGLRIERVSPSRARRAAGGTARVDDDQRTVAGSGVGRQRPPELLARPLVEADDLGVLIAAHLADQAVSVDQWRGDEP